MQAWPISKIEQFLSDVLNGRVLVDEAALSRRPWLQRAVRATEHAACALRRRLFGEEHRPPSEEGGLWSPDAGRPTPLQPRPGHHLVAALSLPPSRSVYLLPKD